MNPNIKKALVYLLAVIIASSAWIYAELLRGEGCRFSIESSGGTISRTFLLDKKTGKVWRYYVNMDENQRPKDEGFTLIKE